MARVWWKRLLADVGRRRRFWAHCAEGFIAPLTVEGGINGELFRAWVEQHLAPVLKKGDIVVMDNLSSHKVPGIRKAIEAAGAEFAACLRTTTQARRRTGSIADHPGFCRTPPRHRGRRPSRAGLPTLDAKREPGQCRSGRSHDFAGGRVGPRGGPHACEDHDLRRSFGTRWARRVPTAVLMRLMRHESIQTTNAYYVDLNADEVAEDLYRSFGGVGSVFGSVAPADGENGGEGEGRNPL